MKRIECNLHKLIHVRDGDQEHPYSVEVECEPHKSNWIALCNSLEDCIKVIDNFPLVCGGLAGRVDAFPIDKDCILANIPKRS